MKALIIRTQLQTFRPGGFPVQPQSILSPTVDYEVEKGYLKIAFIVKPPEAEQERERGKWLEKDR